jgi:hypothetical protein
MSSRTLNQYRIFCITEDKFVTCWSDIKPTICPNNNLDSIDNNSVTIVDTISNNDVNIIQSPAGLTNDTYRMEGFKLSIPANNVGIKDMSWPFNVSILTINLYANIENTGDMICGFAAPNTTIGILTQNVSQGDCLIHVSSSVFGFIKTGHIVTITNGRQKINLEQCIHIDTLNNTITCEIPANAPISQGAYIQFSAQTIKNLEIGNADTISIANKHVSSSSIPKGVICRFIYTNRSNFSKDFSYSVEYLL